MVCCELTSNEPVFSTSKSVKLFSLSYTVIDDKVLLGAVFNGEEFEWLDGHLVRDTFNSWADGQPSGNGDCMGYSKDHSLNWEDFQCDDYIVSDLTVGFICEEPSSGGTTATGKIILNNTERITQ